MRARKSGWLVLLTALMMPAAGPDGRRLAPARVLYETSFEEGQHLPEGWAIAYGTAGEVAWEESAARTGRRGMHLTDRSDKASAGFRSPKLPVAPGELVWATIWLKALGPGGNTLYFEYWDAKGTRMADKVHTQGLRSGAEWQQTRVQDEVPEGAATFTCLVYSGSAGTCDAVFDDLVIGTGFQPTHDRTPLPPAPVQHPCGPYSRDDLARATANLARHEWAREQFESFRRNSQFWIDLPDEQIDSWLSELTPFRAVFCPKCRYNWDYCWEHLPGDRLRCRNCRTEFPNPDYPEDRSVDLITPTGRVIAHPYYQDAQGRRYFLSGRQRYARVIAVSRLGSLGRVYALTGEEVYAQKAVRVMRALARVYPDWVPHDWDRVYSDFSNTQSGRMSGWKLHDCSAMLEIALCYDLIYDSPALTEADKLAVENNVFRELGEMLLPIPQQGCCINDGPFQMSAGAYLGVLLGDHRLIRWAVEPPGGFLGFLRKYFFRDGHWEDGSPSYEAMALNQLYQLPEILQGYSDPPSYTGADRYDKLDVMADPLLKKIHLAPLFTMLPDRTMPPVNDGAKGTGYATRHAEVNHHWYPTERNLGILRWVLGDEGAAKGTEYSLFRRDPDLDLAGTRPVCLNEDSVVRPGLGWAILRAGAGGERSDLILDYGEPCGGHGHPDRLNLVLYANRREVVTDLGYLGARHPDRPWMVAPAAHNLVVVDGATQARQAGRLLVFEPDGPVQAVAAEAAAVYPQCRRYERVLVRLAAGGAQYLVDVFRVAGGQQHDYAFHGDGAEFTCPALTGAKPAAEPVGPKAGGYAWLKSPRVVAAGGEIVADWRFGTQDAQAADVGVRLRLLDTSGELIVGRAPNLRSRSTPFDKPVLDYLYQRRPGPLNTFTAVIEPVKGRPVVQSARCLPVEGPSLDGFGAVAVEVRHPGGTDLVLVAPARAGSWSTTFADRPVRLDGRLGVVRLDAAGKLLQLRLVDGTRLAWGEQAVTSPPSLAGRLVAVDQEQATVTADFAAADLSGRLLLAPDHVDGAYPIARSEQRDGHTVLHLADEPVLRLKVGDAVRIPLGSGRPMGDGEP